MRDDALLHTMYRVADPKQSIRFYEALGMEFRREVRISEAALKELVEDGLFEEMESCIDYFLGFAGREEELQLLFNPAGRAYEMGTAYGHIAVGVDDLDAMLARLKEHGIEPEGRSFRIGDVRFCFVRDPDGYPVEIVERPAHVDSGWQ